MPVKSMDELFLHTLKDIYYAEKQIYKSLPKMAKGAQSPDLQQAFEKHREETAHQIERLETIFDKLGCSRRGIRCEAMDGILGGGERSDGGDRRRRQVRDAGILAAAQTVEHYEIARYGALDRMGGPARHEGGERAPPQTLDEEKKTDQALTQLARQISQPESGLSAYDAML